LKLCPHGLAQVLHAVRQEAQFDDHLMAQQDSEMGSSIHVPAFLLLPLSYLMLFEGGALCF
jgi:hypothetical protein